MSDPAGGFRTRSIHAGQSVEPGTGSIISAIYPSTVYVYDEEGRPKQFDYGRHGCPTRTAYETCLASLEGANHAVAFASGMAAIDACMRLLHPGDRLILCGDLYGGTVRLISEVIAPMGIVPVFSRSGEIDEIAEAADGGASMFWAETPTNPLVSIVDLRGVAKLAKQRQALFGVDNTFASPYLQNPLALGADLVMHSSTKYIGGHSDLTGGLVMTQDSGLYAKLVTLSKLAGATPSPFDCFLALRGVKTLAVRMDAICRSAQAIAEWLTTRSEVSRVWYPGLPDHPGHEVACSQMSQFGGMLAFELAEGGPAAKRLFNAVRVFAFTGSLGGVESILSYPTTMSHVALSQSERDSKGITQGVLRVSVGLEDTQDLIEDLDQAMI